MDLSESEYDERHRRLFRSTMVIGKEAVRQMVEETAELNADMAVWSHAEVERAKREAAALKKDLARKLTDAEIEPEAEDFK